MGIEVIIFGGVEGVVHVARMPDEAEVEHGGEVFAHFVEPGQALALGIGGGGMLKVGEVLFEALGQHAHIGAGVGERFKSHMFILNTGYEGLPHIIIEAMQLKLPVVATNRGGNTEVIEDGVNGLLIEYNDKEKIKEAVIELSKNKDKKNKLIENGAVMARRFNREQMIAGVIKVLDQIN